MVITHAWPWCAVAQGHKNWVLCVAWSPDAQMLATGGMDGVLWLWEPSTGNAIGCCKGRAASCARVAPLSHKTYFFVYLARWCGLLRSVEDR